MGRSKLNIYMRGIGRNVRLIIDNDLKNSGISEGQLEYFITISENEGINQKELAECLGVGKPSVTKAIKKLERVGYIKRVPDETDSRNLKLFLTEHGHEIVSDFIDTINIINQKLMEGLSDEELELFEDITRRIYCKAQLLRKTLISDLD